MTQPFPSCGNGQISTAPANAVSAQVRLNGAAGGVGGNGGSGGYGASLSFSMPVTGGQAYVLNVGCRGANGGYDGNGYGSSGAYQSGGAGTGGRGRENGGNGGGATWMVPSGQGFSSLNAIAGGGGGSGGHGEYGNSGAAGGNGGNADSAGGGGGTEYDFFGSASPGYGGLAGEAGNNGGLYDGGNGGSGYGGYGGAGWYGTTCEFGCYDTGSGGGGGGGGGWNGGGGGGGGSTDADEYGGGGGGAGGGWSLVRTGTGISSTANVGGDGSATITYTIGGVATLTPGAQDFGAVITGQSSATQTFTLTNTSPDTAMTVNAAALTGTDASAFHITSDSCSGQGLVAGGGSCTVTVRFTPTHAGTQGAELNISSDAANGNVFASLSGTGQNPAALSVESAQDLGAITDGQSATKTITVTNNTGDAPLNIGQATVTGANAGDFTVANDGCSTQTVNGGGTCTLDVQLAPTARGAETATLTLPSNDAGSPATVPLTGTGQAPAALSVESTQDLGAVTDDGHSATQTITVTNTGDQPLDIGQATVTGANAGDFTVANDGCSTQTINGGDTCQVDVHFAPTARGAETATLTLPSNDAGSPATVTLTGTGTKAADITASDTSLDLGTLTTGQSNTKTLTLTNTADEPLTIGTLTITGADADQFALAGESDDCSGQTLAAGAGCTVTAQFAPRHAGAFSAALAAPSNASSGTLSVALSGTGQDPTPPPTPQAPAKPQAPTVTVPTLPAHGLVLQAGSPGSRASVNVQMSAPGTVTATVEQYTHGQWITKGTQTVNASQAGPVSLTLGTSISGRSLAAGRYRVLLQASANGQTSPTVSLPLTVALPANGPHGQPRMLSVTLAPRTIVWRTGGVPRLWLSYVLTRAATLNVTLSARVNGTWQQVAVFTRDSAAGTARVQLVGHWKGLLFPPAACSCRSAPPPPACRRPPRRSPSPSATANPSARGSSLPGAAVCTGVRMTTGAVWVVRADGRLGPLR